MSGEKKRFNWKEALFLTGNFLWMVVLYYGCVILGETKGIILPYQICTGAYAAAAIILFGLSLVFSGKVVSKKTGEERTPAQIKLSKRLILWALPLIAVLLIDIIDLFVVEYFREMLSVAAI